MKKDGIYYMMYSANYYMGENYAIGYATSATGSDRIVFISRLEFAAEK